MSDRITTFYSRRKHRRHIMIGAAISLTVVLILLIYYCSAASIHSDTTSLKLVHMVFRHGDRTPTETYANDPYIDYNWPGGWGALTNKGKHQLFELGERLNKRYKVFLENQFSVQDIYVRSSDVDRCHMSGSTLLAGMFPPSEDEIWNPELLWQPIPLHSLPRNLDNIVAMKKPCPTYEEDLKNAYNSEEIQKINNDNAKLYEYLEKYTGQGMSNITAVEFLFNTLEIEEDNGLKLPDWTKSVYPEKLKSIAARSLSIFTETVAMRRMKGGVMLKDIIEHTISKRLNKLKQKIFLYSGHDITLTNIIRTLGFVEDMKPEYGAALIIEAHSTLSNDLEMKLFYYNNTVNEEPYVLKMESCGDPCLLDNFIKVLEPVTPKDWEQECLIHH